MTPRHSDASTGSKGGASKETVDGGTSTRIEVTWLSPFRVSGSADLRVGCQGQTSSTGWEPVGCQKPASGVVCVVVASSGKSLTLACRIGRKSARPSGLGNIALFDHAEQMRCRGRRADLCDAKRPSRVATHTKSLQFARRANNNCCTSRTPESGVSLARSFVQSKLNGRGFGRGVGRASLGGR
jgi:hypothetical protein